MNTPLFIEGIDEFFLGTPEYDYTLSVAGSSTQVAQTAAGSSTQVPQTAAESSSQMSQSVGWWSKVRFIKKTENAAGSSTQAVPTAAESSTRVAETVAGSSTQVIQPAAGSSIAEPMESDPRLFGEWRSQVTEPVAPILTIGSLDAIKLQQMVLQCLADLDTTRGKELVLVVGGTKSGKSTAINYLMGAKLIKYTTDDGEILAKLAEGQVEYAPIGTTLETHTLAPRAYTDTTEGITYCDTGALDDNRSQEYRICATGLMHKVVSWVEAAVKMLAVTIDAGLLYADPNMRELRALVETLSSMAHGAHIATIQKNLIFILTKTSGQSVSQVIARIKRLQVTLEQRLEDVEKMYKKLEVACREGDISRGELHNSECEMRELRYEVITIRCITVDNTFCLDVFDEGESRRAIINFLQIKREWIRGRLDFWFNKVFSNFCETISGFANDALNLLENRLSLPAQLWTEKEKLADVTKHIAHLQETRNNVDHCTKQKAELEKKIAAIETDLTNVKQKVIMNSRMHVILFDVALLSELPEAREFSEKYTEYNNLAPQERDDGLFLAMRKFYINPDKIDWSANAQRLGRGGAADVYKRAYKAAQNNTSIDVAVKQIFDNTVTPALVKEAQLMANFSQHPNIVHFYGITQSRQSSPSFYAIVMECMKCSLSDILYDTNNSDQMLSIEWRMKIASQIVAAIICLHEASVLHRDIKSHNIVLSNDHQTAKLTDFGISKSVTATTDTVVGSLYWLAPEMGETGATKATDIFALGIVIAEIVNRKIPFEGQILPANEYRKKIQAGLLVFSDKFPMLSSLGRDCIKIAPNERPTAQQCQTRLK